LFHLLSRGQCNLSNNWKVRVLVLGLDAPLDDNWSGPLVPDRNQTTDLTMAGYVAPRTARG
jgi:hypothetical protein